MRTASVAAASSAMRFCSAFSASRTAFDSERLAATASRSARRAATAGSSWPGCDLNLFKRFLRASCASFCRSEKPGSLNPLIERTLSSSLSILHHCVLVRRLGIAGAARRRCVYIHARRKAIDIAADQVDEKSPPTISRSPEKLPNCDVPHKGAQGLDLASVPVRDGARA